MGFTGTRKVYNIGGTKAIPLLKNIVSGKVATIVAQRIVLIDPRGEIPEMDLLEFFEKHVEPAFWVWFAEWKIKQQKNNLKNHPKG